MHFQIFFQLPDLQKKIKYPFVHFTYSFLDVKDDPRLAHLSADEVNSEFDYSDSTSDSDSDSDSECDGSINSDEQELEDMEVISRGLLSHEGNTRDGHSRPRLQDTNNLRQS